MSSDPFHNRASAAYRDAEAFPPARQIVLLYDRAIRHLDDAANAARERRLDARFHHVAKAHAIIAALQSCLDHELGGEIAATLDRLYGHILQRLVLVGLDDHGAIRHELLPLLRRMREGWATLANDTVIPPPPRPATAVSTLLCA